MHSFHLLRGGHPISVFFILFGCPAIDCILFSMTKGDRSDTFRSLPCRVTTQKRGTFKVGCEVGC